MVNMYFNGKSFVYCRKQEEKTIKLTYRGSSYLKQNFKFIFKYQTSIYLRYDMKFINSPLAVLKKGIKAFDYQKGNLNI